MGEVEIKIISDLLSFNGIPESIGPVRFVTIKDKGFMVLLENTSADLLVDLKQERNPYKARYGISKREETSDMSSLFE